MMKFRIKSSVRYNDVYSVYVAKRTKMNVFGSWKFVDCFICYDTDKEKIVKKAKENLDHWYSRDKVIAEFEYEPKENIYE